MADVILIALVAAPAVIAILLKSNAALSFLSLCAGFAVISFASNDLENLTGQLNFSINSGTLNLAVLALPLLLTLLLTRRSFSGNPKLILNSVVALCAGGLLALVGIPLLSESVRTNFADSELWKNLQKIQSSVIGVGAFLSLLLIWFNSSKKSKVSKKHK